MGGENDKGGQETATQGDSVAARDGASPPAQPGAAPNSAKETRPFWTRPEICAALIGLVGVLAVPFIEYVLPEKDANARATTADSGGDVENEPSTPPAEVSSEPPVREIEPLLVSGREVGAEAPRDETPSDISDVAVGAIFTIKGVRVQKLDETRIVLLEEALVYPEPSALRQSHIFRYERGEQVALAGKVDGAPWYAVKTNAGYGFVRTNRFSRETVGGE